MSTFEPRRRIASTVGRRVVESSGLALVFGLGPDLVRWPLIDAGVPHPGWVAVVVLAARYGVGGLLSGLLALVAAMALGTTFTGTPLLSAWGRLHTTPDLVAFGACLGVSGVASWHLRCRLDLQEALAAMTVRARQAEETVGALRGAVATLRARVDRSWNALSFLRDVTERLEGPDPIAAAEGAADLALARTGASAVVIYTVSEGLSRPLAVRDARGPQTLAPLLAHEAALKVPMDNGSESIGFISLWGVTASELDPATTRDLEIVGMWCADALAGLSWRPARVPQLIGRSS